MGMEIKPAIPVNNVATAHGVRVNIPTFEEFVQSEMLPRLYEGHALAFSFNMPEAHLHHMGGMPDGFRLEVPTGIPHTQLYAISALINNYGISVIRKLGELLESLESNGYHISQRTAIRSAVGVSSFLHASAVAAVSIDMVYVARPFVNPFDNAK